jgi:protein-tyrosine-phosphatase
MPVNGLRSKGWEEFLGPAAPKLDFVFTVCDNAAKEVCPVWPGKPVTGHWGVPDPAAASGSPDQIARAYRDVFLALERRISLFLSLPLVSMDRITLATELKRIGQSSPAVFK